MGSADFRRCRRRSPWIIARSRRCVLNNSRSRSRSMSRHRPEHRMGMRVNKETGEYDQEDVFSMITAAMGKCLLEDAAAAREMQIISSSSSQNQNGDPRMPVAFLSHDDDTAKALESALPETITLTRDEVIKLATQIAEEMVAKRNATPASRSLHMHQRWRNTVLWTCCNCGFSPMPVSFELSCAESLCGHHRCDMCNTFEGEAALPVLEEEEEEEQGEDGRYEIADHFLGSRSEGSAAVSQR